MVLERLFRRTNKAAKEFTIPVKFTIKVVLTDPYKYSVTGNKNTAISDQVSVVNSGTADTPLIVEARAIKPSSYFMITKMMKIILWLVMMR